MKAIDEIIAMEWEMFQKVNEGGPRASCQEDKATFEGMRRGQFEAWTDSVLELYRDDLKRARNDGRNLVEEKYIRMMEHTSPEEYELLRERVPNVTERTYALARAVSGKLMKQTEELFRQFPRVSGAGRPLHSEEDNCWATSIETYQLGELLTYSETTLEALEKYVAGLERQGVSLARNILENSVGYYGYENLEEAERCAAAREKEPVCHLTLEPGGCSCCKD